MFMPWMWLRNWCSDTRVSPTDGLNEDTTQKDCQKCFFFFYMFFFKSIFHEDLRFIDQTNMMQTFILKISLDHLWRKRCSKFFTHSKKCLKSFIVLEKNSDDIITARWHHYSQIKVYENLAYWARVWDRLCGVISKENTRFQSSFF